MARFIVNAIAGTRSASLLIIISPSDLCSVLLDAIKKRLPTVASRLSLTDTANLQISLRLNHMDGPILGLEDLLSDVFNGTEQTVYAVINDLSEASQPPNHPSRSIAHGDTIQVRIITPEIAQSCPDIDSVKPLANPVSLASTLKDLKGIVQEQLGFPFDDGTFPELHCNCNFAQVIDDNAELNASGPGVGDALTSVIVVHGNNQVDVRLIEEPTQNAVNQVAKHYITSEGTEKTFNLIGHIEQSDRGASNGRHYLKLPVLAICSKRAHDLEHLPSQPDLIVDIHTSESPIEITTHNADVTLSDSGLQDLTVNGVLNIFAVQRWSNAQTESASRGKVDIFKASEAWKHHIGVSDRGISNMLATLRVFADLTQGNNMTPANQDAVLHIIHSLTRFPPAVRAAYILMRGETPRPAERAALAQCIYELLRLVVPLQIVRSDTKRFFEGTRLLFGLILEKAKNLKVSPLGDELELPYINMRVCDVRNMITMKPILSIPVQTKVGLVDLGFFQAFEEGGLLRWPNHKDVVRSEIKDTVWSRAATVTGGMRSQVVVFNADTIRSSRRYVDGGDINKIISPAEYTDLHYLTNLCSRNNLMVIPPANLASTDPPVLTLDREGSLAVYVGREGCGVPGRDILMFRPTSANQEEGVDVSIIEGLLEPILAERKADGTVVFEAYGDYCRTVLNPEEIIMLCVDLSRSMRNRCDFLDLQSNEDAHVRLPPTTNNRNTTVAAYGNVAAENPAFDLPGPDDLKEYLRTHESYEDFLAIIQSGKDDFQRRRNAKLVLQILQQLDEEQIQAKTKKLEDIRRHGSYYSNRTRANNLERDLNTIRNRSLRMQRYENLICAWFLTCLTRNTSLPDPLTWKPGNEVPKILKVSQDSGAGGPNFEIPREHCCHISNEIMEDPVITVDNYTYERKNIERWFRTNETSPLTNLVLDSLDLRPNVHKKEEITAFLNGSDIISKYQQPGRRTRAKSQTMHVTFRSPLNTWTLALPQKLTLRDVWEIAFRLTKGRYPKYEVQHKNVQLPLSQDQIHAKLDTAHTVFITPADSATSNAGQGMEELCLVKVYCDSYAEPNTTYWEPKTTTKSLASTVFRYYRQKFMRYPSAVIEEPFVFWTKMVDAGDGYRTGTVLHNHWELLSQYFTKQGATGRLKQESFVDKNKDDEDSDDRLDLESYSGDQPLVFKVYLGGKPSSDKVDLLSRLDVLKQMFDAFINRILAYNCQTHLGLVKFASKASVSQPLTHAVENFRHKLNNLSASGDTALWDSVALAQDQLLHYAEKYPNAKMRIICISDGEDNKSKNTAVDLASRLLRSGITVDSFCLGDATNRDLQTLSYLTNGFIFKPETLDEAMAICEMEPVLSVLQRPEPSNQQRYRARFRRNPDYLNFYTATGAIVVERVTADHCPARKEHQGLRESFVELRHFAKSTSQVRTDNNVRLSRIHNEIRNSGVKLHPHYDVYICEPNMGLWKIVMQGPPESTYAGGTFLLYVEMGEKYPMSPPEARFITPIYHPNINRHGRICHSILDRNWTVDTSTKNIIDTIYSLLLVPEFSDPINTVVTLNYHWDEVQFKEEAQQHLAKHASKTREEWRKEIVG